MDINVVIHNYERKLALLTDALARACTERDKWQVEAAKLRAKVEDQNSEIFRLIEISRE